MVCVLNISGGKRLTLFHVGPECPRGPPSLLYQGHKDTFPYIRQPMHGIEHPPHPAPTLSMSRAIPLLLLPLCASNCILYLSLYHLLQFNIIIFFFQALDTVWIFNIKKIGINTNTQILYGIKYILNIRESVLIQRSNFSYQKLRLKSEPNNYDISKNANCSEVSNELCPSQY